MPILPVDRSRPVASHQLVSWLNVQSAREHTAFFLVANKIRAEMVVREGVRKTLGSYDPAFSAADGCRLANQRSLANLMLSD